MIYHFTIIFVLKSGNQFVAETSATKDFLDLSHQEKIEKAMEVFIRETLRNMSYPDLRKIAEDGIQEINISPPFTSAEAARQDYHTTRKILGHYDRN